MAARTGTRVPVSRQVASAEPVHMGSRCTFGIKTLLRGLRDQSPHDDTKHLKSATAQAAPSNHYYFVFWATDSSDTRRKWNPNSQGASDGIQLAKVKDGLVTVIPTNNTCMHASSHGAGSKEWIDVEEPFRVIDHPFFERLSLDEADKMKNEFGLAHPFVGKPGWGGNLILVKSMWETFFDSKASCGTALCQDHVLCEETATSIKNMDLQLFDMMMDSSVSNEGGRADGAARKVEN